MSTEQQESCRISILMPCLNEQVTLGQAIDEARSYLMRTGLSSEIVIADNGSTDGSKLIAERHGARVVDVQVRGYGAALRGGIASCNGEYIIFGDCDLSYDFANLEPFVAALDAGADVVIGDRFAGGIEIGAMPLLHRYLGNPVLSCIGRRLFKVKVHDFHCGLRAVKRSSIEHVELHSTGMEFATEMIAESAAAGLKIAEVPTKLRKDGRDRPPHLRTFRDGWRHLVWMFSRVVATWANGLGGLILFIGLTLGLLLSFSPLKFGRIGLDIGSLVVSQVLSIVGYQMIFLAVFASEIDVSGKKYFSPISLRTHLTLASFSVVLGIIGIARAAIDWSERGFGTLNSQDSVRAVTVPVAFLTIGVVGIVNLMVIGMIRLRKSFRQ